MCTKAEFLSLVVILVAFRSMGVAGGRAKPALRRGNFSTTTLSPSNSTFPPSGAVGLWGYSRFHANDSLVGRSVPCSDDQKICFRYNMLFDPKSDRCQPLGGGHAPGCDLRINRTEFERGSGHIYGICRKYQDPCPGYRLAYDGRCYRKQMVREVLCGCGAEPSRHFLGGVECRCSLAPPPVVQQPTRKRRCFIPDLLFPTDLSTAFKVSSPARNASGVPAARPDAQKSHLSCSAEQRKCFALGQVWVAQGRGCFPLLQRGPCAEDEVVVMPRTAWAREPALCRHPDGGCPPGQRRMAFDRGCHDAREMQLVAPGRIALDIFGEYEVLDFPEVKSHTPGIFNGTCVVFSTSSMARLPPPEMFPPPPCAPGNKGLCHLHKVVSEFPAPEYDYYDDAVNGI